MTPPFAVEWLGYTLYAWLVLCLYIVATSGSKRGIPWQFTVYFLISVIFTVSAYKPRFALLGIHGTYNNGLAQTALVVAAASLNCDRHKLRKWLLALIALFSFQALLQFAIPNTHWLTPSGYWAGRAYATLGSPVYLGSFLAVAGVWALPGASWPYWMIWGMALAATKTRGAMLAAIIGLLATNRKNLRFSYWWGVGALVLALGVGALRRDTAGVSDSYRSAVWRVCGKAIAQKPMMGWGPENAYFAIESNRDAGFDVLYHTTTQDHCHNQVLEALVTGGIPMAVASALLAAFILLGITGDSGRGTIIAYLVCGVFNPVPLSVQVLSALIYSTNLRKSATMPIRPIWLATASLIAALYCARNSFVAHDYSLPASVRYSAARDIGIVE